MRRQITLALTVVVPVLAGCSFGPTRGQVERLANEPSPTGVASSPQADFHCGPAEGEAGDIIGGNINFGPGNVSSDIVADGYEVVESNGRAWLNKKTGAYCAEEGSSVKFPNRSRIEGPRRGNSYKEQGKAVCYTSDVVIGISCNYKISDGKVLWLSNGWFEGQCDEPPVARLLAEHNISLEDSGWENCDMMGAWKAIDLPK